jgi:hypothetical protein
MDVSQAIEIAKQWVEVHGSRVPGFYGAHFSGAINRLPRDALFPSYRDVDVYVVVEDVEKSGQRQQKLFYKGIILETVFCNLDGYRSAEEVLSNPLSAHNLAVPSVISDPTGKLTELQRAVAQGFAQRRWVQERCESAKQSIRTLFDEWNEANTREEWGHCFWRVLLRTGDLVAVAHLRPPTVRRCLEQIRELLQHQDRLTLHESILQVLGSAHMNREQVESALQECLKAFDRAAEVIQTSVFGDFQLHSHVRPYLAEGAQEMIDKGHHREAMWWISLNHAVSNKAIQNDAPEDEKAGFQAEFDRLVAELGLLTLSDCQRRLELAKSVADEVFQLADEVVEAHPDIKA